MPQEFIHESRVAYFSMEMALRSSIPTYSGGLGVLAGDTLRTAADLDLPMVGVSLVSRAGYFRQSFDAAGNQVESAAEWTPADVARLLSAKVALAIEGRQVWIGAWLYVLESHLGGRQPVLLLDSDFPENQPEDRQITARLYGGDELYRLKQEMVLGIGGARMLQALDFNVRAYHMNEGHSALLGLELLRRYAYRAEDLRADESPYNIPRVRALCRFTTHTPVVAGHDRFSYELVQRAFTTPDGETEFIDAATLRRLAGETDLNMTSLGLNLSEYVNGVAEKHAEISRKMFPGYRVHAITNGVHPFTWVAKGLRAVYDQHVPGWCHEPELLARIDACVPDAVIWDAHMSAKQDLINRVRTLSGVQLSLDEPILGFARRMTAYKRMDLLFTDLGRLRSIAATHPFQVVFAGKAHPHDREGKDMIARLHGCVAALQGAIRVVFLPDYDMDLAAELVAGSDVWVNTPLPPLEASGTSGMKAALNGVPSFSVLDGWWIEGCLEGVTGWAIGTVQDADGAAALYDKLQSTVLPLFYRRDDGRAAWLRVMKSAISKNGSYFNSHRMMRRYATESYLH